MEILRSGIIDAVVCMVKTGGLRVNDSISSEVRW